MFKCPAPRTFTDSAGVELFAARPCCYDKKPGLSVGFTNYRAVSSFQKALKKVHGSMHLRYTHKTSNFEVAVFSHFLTLRLIGSRVVVGNPRFSYPIYLSRSFPLSPYRPSSIHNRSFGRRDGMELRNGAKKGGTRNAGKWPSSPPPAAGWPSPDRSFVSPDSPLLCLRGVWGYIRCKPNI